MAYFGNNFNQNQGMINQLLRQKENMITQYSQPPAPVQTIINTGSNNFEFEARILKDDEDISNIAIMRKTLFVDEKNKKISIKEVDGSISKEYEIIVPLDEKEMAYGKVLTKDIAEKAVADMKPDGEHWSIEQTTSVKKQYGYEEIDDVEFYAVMNMAWNDYKDLFKDDLEMYAKFSKAFISDIDAKKDKVYDSIVK